MYKSKSSSSYSVSCSCGCEVKASNQVTSIVALIQLVYSENSENQRYTRIMDVEALNIEDLGLTIQVKNSILKKETLM